MKLKYLYLVDKIINKRHLNQFDIEIAKNVLHTLENFSGNWLEALVFGTEGEALDQEVQHIFAIDLLEFLFPERYNELLQVQLKNFRDNLIM